MINYTKIKHRIEEEPGNQRQGSMKRAMQLNIALKMETAGNRL
jgi:hypothetical protein